MPSLTLCADDFALSRPISETIAELANDAKINATSCMAVCEGWQADSALLRNLPPGFQVGLHLTLTDERPVTPMPRHAKHGQMPHIDRLGRMAIAKRLALDEVAQEIRAQFGLFGQALGRPPDFVDAHQHAHVLPGIRAVVLAETARSAPNAWVRDCGDTLLAMLSRPWRLKAFASAVHAAGIASAARNYGLRTNSGFAGHYDFQSDYAHAFPQFLRRPGHRHLVMCHPGAGRLAGDTIAGARQVEAAALRRLSIPSLAEQHGLEFGTELRSPSTKP